MGSHPPSPPYISEFINAYLLLAAAFLMPNSIRAVGIIDDLNVISRHWGQMSSYHDNRPDYFGVKEVGLPDGCGIEQVHVLHRFVRNIVHNMHTSDVASIDMLSGIVSLILE